MAADIVAAAFRCGTAPPNQALKTPAAQIRIGSIAYLYEPADVLGPIGDNGLQLSLEDGTTAFLVGVSIANAVSGSRIVPGLVRVLDSAEYKTILGANRSGWVLDRIDSAEWSKAEQLVAEHREKERRETIAAELQTLRDELNALKPQPLTSADGAHTTTATILGASGGAYLIRRTDGKEIRVDSEKLDDDSQFRARSQLRRVLAIEKRIEQITKELTGETTKPLALD
jgi:hypothetical protein